MHYYGIHLYDLSHYDIIISTDTLGRDEVLAKAIEEIDALMSHRSPEKISAPEAYFVARKKYLGS